MGSVRDFQDTDVYKPPAGSPAGGALDPPIPYAMQSFDAVEPLAEFEACLDKGTRPAAGLPVVDVPAVELAVIVVGLEFELVL